MKRPEFRPSRFRVVLTAEQLDRVGCAHYYGSETTCRPCSITQSILWAVEMEWMDLDWTTVDGKRVIEGAVYASEGRDAFTRLLALAHGHPEPASLLV